jgi:peptidoglycan/LPS O-acetylase OafA/YrhL
MRPVATPDLRDLLRRDYLRELVPRRRPSRMKSESLASHLRPGTNNFDLVRLIAAIAVVFGHSFALARNQSGYTEPFLQYLKFTYSGTIGVGIFFLISGIFVTQSLAADGAVSKFILKRFLRIWPGLIVCLVVTTLISALVSGVPMADFLSSPDTYSFILNNARLNLVWKLPGVFEDSRYGINGSLWTLPLEAKMYSIVLIFGIFGIISRSPLLLLAATILSLGFIVLPVLFQPFIDLNALNIIASLFFFAGMGIFALRTKVRVTAAHLVCVGILSILAIGIAQQVFFYIFVGLLTLWLGCSEIIASRLPKLPGDYSYGTYIYAFPIQQSVASLWPSFGGYQVFLVSTLLVLPFAIASWHLVELPAQIFGRALIKAAPGGRQKGTFPALLMNWQRMSVPIFLTVLCAIAYSWAQHRIANFPPDTLPAQIVTFGPNPVQRGQPFNKQPSGESAIYVKLDRPAEKGFVLVLGGTELSTMISGDLLTAGVPTSLFQRPGSLPLWVQTIRSERKLRSNVVNFLIE